MHRKCLQIFAKAPVPGQVKTRLQTILTPGACAQLHQRLTLRTLETAVRVAHCTIQLWCHPNTRHPFFRQCQKDYAASLHPQHGSDLGERMRFALNKGLQGHSFVLLVGADCPDLSTDYLENAFSALETSSAVLGPARDGGFVLLGVRQSLARHAFSGIHWGSSTVFERTIEGLERGKLSVATLPILNDIDRPEDLACLDYSPQKH